MADSVGHFARVQNFFSFDSWAIFVLSTTSREFNSSFFLLVYCYFNLESSNMSDTGRSPGRVARAGSGGAAVRQRRGGTFAGSGRSSRSGVSSGGLWRFYTEDATGLKIGPVPVLVMSLVFIASVFILHIWGKYTRTHH
ncbi:Protein transport protein Sec61 subunit beta [Dirofilaria immitis]